ncbi:response regulator [Pedobacter agri]|uniref:response regulator n=1 Tax=Pedobacter agri TaxID=454586 RepID=UPI00292E8347|nr:response regulator [Pedobacter agri]
MLSYLCLLILAPIKKILFIDDEPTLLEIAPLLFDEYEVLASDKAESIVRFILEFKPDLILLDVIMGTISGVNICKAIKADSNHSHIPIILMTAGVVKQEFYQSGADEIVEKPFDTLAVKALIDKFLGNQFF